MSVRREQQQRDTTVYIGICDFCWAESEERAAHTCHICKRDCCPKCTAGWTEEPDEGWSDYPSWYCPQCWELGAARRDQAKTLEQQAEALIEQWHEEAYSLVHKESDDAR